MKTKNFDKKLILNKTTIVTLELKQMNELHGGTLPTEMKCKPTDRGCPTDVPYC